MGKYTLEGRHYQCLAQNALLVAIKQTTLDAQGSTSALEGPDRQGKLGSFRERLTNEANKAIERTWRFDHSILRPVLSPEACCLKTAAVPRALTSSMLAMVLERV